MISLSVSVSSHAVQRTSSETSHSHLHAAALLPLSPAATGTTGDADVALTVSVSPAENVTVGCLHVSTLQACLSPSPAEVSACLWADSRLVGAVVSSVDGEDAEVCLDDLPSSIRYLDNY